jgi:hypothetical protein
MEHQVEQALLGRVSQVVQPTQIIPHIQTVVEVVVVAQLE